MFRLFAECHAGNETKTGKANIRKENGTTLCLLCFFSIKTLTEFLCKNCLVLSLGYVNLSVPLAQTAEKLDFHLILFRKPTGGKLHNSIYSLQLKSLFLTCIIFYVIFFLLFIQSLCSLFEVFSQAMVAQIC